MRKYHSGFIHSTNDRFCSCFQFLYVFPCIAVQKLLWDIKLIGQRTFVQFSLNYFVLKIVSKTEVRAVKETYKNSFPYGDYIPVGKAKSKQDKKIKHYICQDSPGYATVANNPQILEV